MSNIDTTLKERGSRYGEFPDHACITQDIKRSMGAHEGWHRLADDQKEALEMVAHKIGRIVNGDPNYIDSWTDIIGYARLVEKRLIDDQKATTRFAFDSNQSTTFGAQCQEEVPAPAPKSAIDQFIERTRAKIEFSNRCSVGEKSVDADTLRKTDSMASMLESELRKIFGADIEVVCLDAGT